jgi:hypothetical protein
MKAPGAVASAVVALVLVEIVALATDYDHSDHHKKEFRH